LSTKINTNFNLKAKQLKKMSDILAGGGGKGASLQTAMHGALSLVANTAVRNYMEPKKVQNLYDPAGDLLSIRTGRLAGSLVGAWRFASSKLPGKTQAMLPENFKSNKSGFNFGKKESIRKVATVGGNIQGIVGTDVFYAQFHEKGTSLHKERPFLEPAAKDSMGRIEQIFESLINETFRKAKI